MVVSPSLDAAISVENLKTGSDEWYNVQAPVRFALEVILGHLKDHSGAIRHLDSASSAFDSQGGRYASQHDLDQIKQQLAEVQGSISGRIARAENAVIELEEKLQRQMAVVTETLGQRLGQLEPKMEATGRRIDEMDRRVRSEGTQMMLEVDAKLQQLGERLDRGLERNEAMNAEASRGSKEALGAAREMRRQLEPKVETSARRLDDLEQRIRVSEAQGLMDAEAKLQQVSEQLQRGDSQAAEALGAAKEALALSRETKRQIEPKVESSARRLDEIEQRIRLNSGQGLMEVELKVQQLSELLERGDGQAAESARLAKEAVALSRDTQRDMDRLATDLAGSQARLQQGSMGDGGRLQDISGRLEGRLAASNAQIAELRSSLMDLEVQAREGIARLEHETKSARDKADRANARAAEAERRLASDLSETQQQLQSSLGALKAETAGLCEAEGRKVEGRLADGVQSQIDAVAKSMGLQVDSLRKQMHETQRAKVDKSSMEKFTSEILDAIDRSTAISISEVEEKIMAELSGLKREVASTMASVAIAQDLEVATGRVDEAIAGLDTLRFKVEDLERDAKRPSTFCTREEAESLVASLLRKAELARDSEALGAAIARASEAAASAMDIVQAEAGKNRHLKEQVEMIVQAIYGPSPPGTGEASGTRQMSSPALAALLSGTSRLNHLSQMSEPQNFGSDSRGQCILKRLDALHDLLQQLGPEVQTMGSKLAGSAPQEKLQELEAVVAAHSEKLDELSSDTYRRVNEHAGSLSSLHKLLATNFADRPTLGAVELLIEDAIATANEEVLDQVRNMVDSHTHVVEHSERVLLRDDGSRVVVDSGALAGIKVEDDGRQNLELWSRVQTLTAEQKALHHRLADYETRSRSPTRHGSPGGSPNAADVSSAVKLVKHRMQMLETAHERTVSELKTVSAKVDLAARAARASPGLSPPATNPNTSKIDDRRLEQLMTHVGTMLDEKASRSEVMHLVEELEKKLPSRSPGGSRQSIAMSLESEAFGPGLESKFRSQLAGKADKSTVDDMFRSLSRALDSRPSHAELQAALKEKLDTRTYLAALSGKPNSSSSGTPQAGGQQRQGTASPRSVSSAGGRDRSLNLSMSSPLSTGDATTPGSAFKRYSAARANLEEQARAIFNTTIQATADSSR